MLKKSGKNSVLASETLNLEFPIYVCGRHNYSLLVETDYCLLQQYSRKIRLSFCQATTACLQLFLSGRKKLSDEEIQELKEESESDINDQASEGALCNLFTFQRILEPNAITVLVYL